MSRPCDAALRRRSDLVLILGALILHSLWLVLNLFVTYISCHKKMCPGVIMLSVSVTIVQPHGVQHIAQVDVKRIDHCMVDVHVLKQLQITIKFKCTLHWMNFDYVLASHAAVFSK